MVNGFNLYQRKLLIAITAIISTTVLFVSVWAMFAIWVDGIDSNLSVVTDTCTAIECNQVNGTRAKYGGDDGDEFIGYDRFITVSVLLEHDYYYVAWISFTVGWNDTNYCNRSMANGGHFQCYYTHANESDINISSDALVWDHDEALNSAQAGAVMLSIVIVFSWIILNCCCFCYCLNYSQPLNSV